MSDYEFLNQLRAEPIYRTDIYYGILFHGTRRYSFECPKEERESLHRASKIVIDYVDNLLNNGYFDWQKLNEYTQTKKIGNKETEFSFIMTPKGKETSGSLYQYGDFYVSNDFEYVVENFCDSPGGEYVHIAYCKVVGLKDFKVEVPDEVKLAMEFIEKEYPKHANSERIVVAVGGVEIKDLLFGGGSTIHIDNDDLITFYKSYKNFRLINFEKYRDKAFVIPESSFKEVRKAIRESKTK